MGRLRGGGPYVRALLVVGAAMLMNPAGTATAAGLPGAGTATAPSPSRPSSTTLPALPKVAPEFTDGQPPQKLLDNAVSLASLGLDDTALMSAIGVTQAELDKTAVELEKARGAAATTADRLTAARKAFSDARAQYSDMADAIRQAAIFLYTSGPDPLPLSSKAGLISLYAQDYAESTIGPFGVLARGQQLKHALETYSQAAEDQAKLAASAEARAATTAATQQKELKQLKEELASASAASASALEADHLVLTDEAGRELSGQGDLEFTPTKPLPTPLPTTSIALTWAFAQLGKQYVWGATGPDSFDCSGLTQYVWKEAGASIPRVASDQDEWSIPVPLSQLLPGDLVFFGATDIHHVGIYIGDGLMINAPHTGTVVQVSSIWWADLAGFGRVHSPTTPVPLHPAPSPAKPAKPSVNPGAGPVPSQTKPPAGWKPGPGSSAPINLNGSDGGSTASGTSSSTTTSAAPSTSTTATDPNSVAPPPSSTTTTSVTGSSSYTGPTTSTTAAAS